MATFTATDPRLGAVTWDDGRLLGDPRAVSVVQAVVRSGVDVQLSGLGSWTAGLRDHPQALATVVDAMPDATITGDQVLWDPLPPGAVA